MVYLIITVVLIGALIIWRNYRKNDIRNFKIKSSLEFAYPLAFLIYDTYSKRRRIILKNSTRERLWQIGINNSYEYVVSRIAKGIALFLGVLILADFSYLSYVKGNYINNNSLEKSSEPMTYPLIVSSDKEEVLVDLEVLPRVLTKEEIFEKFDRACEAIGQQILGENKSFEEIRTNLNFIDKYEEFDVTYQSECDLINFDGTIDFKNLKEDTDTYITVKFTYLDYVLTYDYELVLKKPTPTTSDEIISNLEEEVLSQQYKEKVKLPEKIDGKKVNYKRADKDTSYLFFLAGIVGVALFFILPDDELGKKHKERNNQMLVDYSRIVSKLTLLLGSGMTIYLAWEKIVQDYRKNKTLQNRRYAYDEMEIAYNRMQNGFSKNDSYEEFSKRCHLPEYTKLISIITQNMKKGNEGLITKLELESQQAFLNRKNYAMTKGEEASTKLMLPMSLELLVVILVIMIPVFMSFAV